MEPKGGEKGRGERENTEILEIPKQMKRIEKKEE